MENAVEALKIAFAVGMFVLALTLSMSSFSNASSVVTSIIEMRDRETEYTYVESSEDLTRTVGIETVVSTMYRAFQENIEIHFFDKYYNPIVLYTETDSLGNEVDVTCINLARERFSTQAAAKDHLDTILGGEEGLYNKFKDEMFEELLGEYYQGEGASQIKKRVITYKLL